MGRSFLVALIAAAVLLPSALQAQPAGFTSSLATTEQAKAERMILAALQRDEVKAAQRRAAILLRDLPMAQTRDGKARLDNAVQKWTLFAASQILSSDAARPYPYWWVTNSGYSWFGHSFPGSGAAIDSPDNIYRSVTLDGSQRYVIKGQTRPLRPAQFSFQMVPAAGIIPTGGDLETLGVVSSRGMDIRPDGSFEISVDPEPANGRTNHFQSRPGLMKVIIRDTLSNWRQSANELRVENLSQPNAKPTVDATVLADRLASELPDIVAGWLKFVSGYFEPQKDNVLVGPVGRTGAWGYMAPMRFEIADDEAVVITTDDGGSEYASVQLCDVWMLAADPQKHLSSYTMEQSKPNPDGTFTYVVAKVDPGAPNWVDTAGWNRGWLQFRWQGTPRTRHDSAGLVRSVRIVKLAALKDIVPGPLDVTSAQRAASLDARAAEWRLRVAGPQ
jgi:hypothetical protein